MMKFAIHKPCPRGGIPVLDAFKRSLSKHTYFEFTAIEIVDCDIMVMWSVLGENRSRLLDLYRAANIPVIVLEVGFLKRNILWRIGLNGINRTAHFGNGNSSPDRWQKLSKQFSLELKPWNHLGQNIIICTQNQLSGAWSKDFTVYEYVENMVNKIREQTNRPIIIRRHPRTSLHFDMTMKDVTFIDPITTGIDDNFDFQDVLKHARLVLNYNSNPALEAIMAGVPVIVDQSSLAWKMGSDIKRIDKPKYPNRDQWIFNIANIEWTVDEIEMGVPLKRLLNLL